MIPNGLTVADHSQCTLPRTLRIPSYREASSPLASEQDESLRRCGARGATRRVRDRALLDFAAKELGIDRAEIRRRNLPGRPIPVQQRDLVPGLRARSPTNSGDYEPALDEALKVIDYQRFVREEQPRLKAAGRHVGIGVVCYVEGTGIGPYEGARSPHRSPRDAPPP